LRNLTSMCKSEVGIIIATPEAPLLSTASTSFLVPLAALKTLALKPCLAMRLTDSISPSETAANPASIKSTPSASRRWAIRSLFSGTSDIPGVCSPSRRVVSKNFTCLGKRLNKAIPHLNHIHFQGVNLKYKIIGDIKMYRGYLDA
jgi:hypothetical protein